MHRSLQTAHPANTPFYRGSGEWRRQTACCRSCSSINSHSLLMERFLSRYLLAVKGMWSLWLTGFTGLTSNRHSLSVGLRNTGHSSDVFQLLDMLLPEANPGIHRGSPSVCSEEARDGCGLALFCTVNQYCAVCVGQAPSRHC